MADPNLEALRNAVLAAIPDAQVDVQGGSPGHYSLSVTSSVFEGKNLLQKQRMVYSAIADLLRGDTAPVHAIDSLHTRTP